MTEDKKVIFSQVLQLEKTPMMTRDKPIVFRKVLKLEKTLIMTGDKPTVFLKVLQLEQTLLVAFTVPGGDKKHFEGKQSSGIRADFLSYLHFLPITSIFPKLPKR